MTELSTTIIEHKRTAERLFLACVLIQPDMARHDCGWLSPKNFHDDRYGKFWADVLNCKDVHQAAIDAKIYTELVGSQIEIATSNGYAGFAKSIADDDWLLKIAIQLPEIAKAVGIRDREAIQKRIGILGDAKITSLSVIPSAIDVGMQFAELIGKDTLSIDTYIRPLDAALGGYARKTINIVAGRPGMGKSSLAWQIARNMARDGQRVIYFSLEMAATTLWGRAACGLAGVTWKQVMRNELTPEQQTKLIDVSGSLMNQYGDNLLIDDRARLTSADIWQSVSAYKPDAFIVDHSSLLSDKANSEILRLGEITKNGKQIAKEFNCVAIYLSQLSRKVEERNDKRPVMSDLRDSGEIEQNADTVLFLYRDDYYGKPSPGGAASKTELIIGKNRDGKGNIVAEVYYDQKMQWFEDHDTAARKGWL